MIELTDNEVIGVFMGGNPSEHHMPKGTYIFFEQIYHGQHLYAYKKMKYATSFDWLMPVWYKFRDLKVEAGLGDFTLHKAAIERAICHQGIEEACKLLAEGIRWYNSVKK